MDGGKITDIGTHDELMKTSTIYREVYDSQQKELRNNAAKKYARPRKA